MPIFGPCKIFKYSIQGFQVYIFSCRSRRADSKYTLFVRKIENFFQNFIFLHLWCAVSRLFYIFVKKKLYTYFSLAEIYKMTYRMWVLVKKSNFRIYPQIGLLDPSPDSDLHLKVTFPTSDEPMRSDWLSNETMCTSPALQSQ